MRAEYASINVTDYGKDLIAQARADFSTLHNAIERMAPSSRARSIALTKLEEASHFAIRAIAEANREEG